MSSDLIDKIRADRDSRKKRLEELKQAKQTREARETLNPSSLRTSRATLGTHRTASSLMSLDTVLPDQNTLALGLRIESEEPKRSIGISRSVEVTIAPRNRNISYEREIQVNTLKQDDVQVEEMPFVEPTPVKAKIFRKPKLAKHSFEEDAPRYHKKPVLNTDFSDFCHRAGRLVERALGQEMLASSSDTSEAKEICTFFDKSRCTDQCVSSLEWSTLYPEVLLASYSRRKKESRDSTYNVFVWALSRQSRPEFELTSSSAVTTASFNPFHSNLVIGGSYSGQILVWDLRVKSSPVARSPLISESHSHPICSLAAVGSQHANNLVSASTDGKICVWSLNMMSAPTTSFGKA